MLTRYMINDYQNWTGSRPELISLIKLLEKENSKLYKFFSKQLGRYSSVNERRIQQFIDEGIIPKPVFAETVKFTPGWESQSPRSDLFNITMYGTSFNIFFETAMKSKQLLSTTTNTNDWFFASCKTNDIPLASISSFASLIPAESKRLNLFELNYGTFFAS